MKNPIISIVFVFLMLSSANSFAGLPSNATLIEKAISHHGEVYRTYAINCVGKSTDAFVTSWGVERKWCEGRNGSLKNCSIKKKKVAKSVCDAVPEVSSS